MLAETGKATAGGTMAKPVQNALLLAHTYYHGHSAESSPKSLAEKFSEQLGELLLYLQTHLSQEERIQGWQVFEQLLRHYVSVKNLGGPV